MQKTKGPQCGHGVCSQVYINTGDASCVLEECAECGALIQSGNPSEVSADHDMACSLHPESVAEAQEDAPAEADDTCGACEGTGIGPGRYGDADTSTCGECRGSGARKSGA